MAKARPELNRRHSIFADESFLAAMNNEIEEDPRRKDLTEPVEILRAKEK